MEELDPTRRMLAAHRGSGSQHRVFLAPQLCVAAPILSAVGHANHHCVHPLKQFLHC